MTLTPPPEKFFATINDIPDETTATINELLNDIDARQFFNTVVTTLNKYSIGSNNHRIVPSVLASSYYALQNHGYILPKSSLDIKIKFGDKMKKNEQQTTIEGQIKCLIEDLTDYWKNDQTIGWQKLIRNFILGFEMHTYYENIVSKKSNKKNKRKYASDTNESNSVKSKECDFVKKNVEIYSKCINTIMKSNQIIDIINKTAKDLNPDTEDYNFQNAVREITSDNMKFSYLFKPLGKDIIQVNNVHGKNILSVILNYAKRLNVNNEKLKNGLIMINNNYLFRVYSDPVKNSNDKSAKKARLDFNALGTDTESAASKHYKSQFEALQSELNNLKADNRVSTNRGRIAKPERKANKYLNRVKHDEDELLHYPLEEYNSEYEDYSFGGEFNPDQKSDMHNKIVTVMNGLNQETIEEINNIANHMIQNEMVHNEDKENYSSAITDFCENITDEQKKIYDDMAEILNIQAVNDFWQDVEKLNRRNKINNSKEKYLDHLEESTYEGNTLPDGVKITKLPPINYAEGDETDDGIPSNEANDYSDDDKEALPPEDSLYFVLSSSKVWTLPSGKNVGDIYTEKISENAHTVKNKKRLTAIKKAILRYGSLRIIDLSTHMKKWFCENDKKFIKKDYESMLRVLKMTGKESSFVLKVEDI
ncbi:hypothetical protein GLOIN_2v1841252 [Rhizophagus irregularis DAOM 181602=DAOM 197198]|nr:hypothetical protein GLOIN_2v1841252 [Rhizophagus irregularis DAOM 181602=DAOM 197198]